ncbi:hypothetical protein EVAR_75705_1 [Eumeta japonica]|uniref:Uncharacterized protein n=1 Tax=Eumeta variegata TaxID=151549 RepID=A0A4C1VZZ4_EUMVA|nr:hypothetical protein EVAR_75705_1 [Eumeta japonica]
MRYTYFLNDFVFRDIEFMPHRRQQLEAIYAGRRPLTICINPINDPSSQQLFQLAQTPRPDDSTTPSDGATP